MRSSTRWFVAQAVCALLVIGSTLYPRDAAAAVSATATKDCSVSPCAVVVNPPIVIKFAQSVHWEATYQGNGTQGNDFYLTTNPMANMADIALSTSLVSGFNSGNFVLSPGTYYISVRLAVMGPGGYTVTYNPNSSGEPHLTTMNGQRYDFQSAGEFVFLRHDGGLEIQTRQTGVSTNPGPEGACVSINSAVAARVGRTRVTYEPNLNGMPDPTGLQLRVDGVLTGLDERGTALPTGGRMSRTSAPGGLRIDFPDGTNLFVTPGWWASHNIWYLNLDVNPARDGVGIIGAIGPKTWLPSLPDGSTVGAPPSNAHDRYVTLNQTFADAWRVTDSTTLFDYAPGTSTSTFTVKTWPPERPPCDAPGGTPTASLPQAVAQAACSAVTGQNASCVYDVMVSGNPGFAATYVLAQAAQFESAPGDADGADDSTRPLNLWLLLLVLLIGILIGLLLCALKRRRSKLA